MVDIAGCPKLEVITTSARTDGAFVDIENTVGPAALDVRAEAPGDALQVIAFDHLVLNVNDVERSLAFYCGVLGLQPVRVDEWRAGKIKFPSVRVDASTIIDLFSRSGGGSNVDHICLVVRPLDWQQVIASGIFTLVEGPVGRFGARGSATSIYVRDPDANIVELRWYPQDRPA
ncbi:VOC family protein [Actinoplanes sp. NPDC023714]|uniref:VOC family protein n=1 Tax=Actinoplanes sp. NPDC023714 TaxID=3154322 RepID=UPI0033F22A7A